MEEISNQNVDEIQDSLNSFFIHFESFKEVFHD